MFFRGFIEAGIMREPDDPATLPAFVKAAWIVSDNWLSFLESGGEAVEPESMRRGIDVLIQVFRPYVTEEALRELSGSQVGDPEHQRSI